MKVPGVLKVVRIDPPAIPSEFQPLGGVAVIARNTWAAMKGRDALKITWDDGPNAVLLLRRLPRVAGGVGAQARQGGAQRGRRGRAPWRAPPRRVEAEYFIPHLAQAPMEPPAAMVRIVDGHCEAWACAQAPQVTRDPPRGAPRHPPRTR